MYQSSMSWNSTPAPQRSETWARKIEHKTKQAVSIETTLTDNNLAKCHSQCQSPLYQLPKEIRDLIFVFASTQSPDARHEYKDFSYYYRPGHKARLKTYTDFLLTCRRVWLEANSFPMQQAEHAFWLQRGPYDVEADKQWPVNVRREQHRYGNAIQLMTNANRSNLTHVHLFTQMFQAEQFVNHYIFDTFFPRDQIMVGLKPKVFHITIRHSDWKDWEVDRPLYLDEKWVQAILDEPLLGAVEEFRLELEAWDTKKGQLDSIVERLQKLEGRPKSADPTDPKCNRASKFILKGPLETWQWSRSPRLQDQDWPIFKDISTLDLHAVILKWRAEYTSVSGDLPSPGPPLNNAEAALFFPRPTHSPHSLGRRSLPTLAHHVAIVSVARAEAMEQVRRERFERLMGDVEAKNVIEEWKSQGSLLKLEPKIDNRIVRPLINRPDLSWLNKFRI